MATHSSSLCLTERWVSTCSSLFPCWMSPYLWLIEACRHTVVYSISRLGASRETEGSVLGSVVTPGGLTLVQAFETYNSWEFASKSKLLHEKGRWTVPIGQMKWYRVQKLLPADQQKGLSYNLNTNIGIRYVCCDGNWSLQLSSAFIQVAARWGGWDVNKGGGHQAGVANRQGSPVDHPTLVALWERLQNEGI